MSETLDQIRWLLARGEALVSNHAYDELAADDILAGDAIAGAATAVMVEDYPQAPKGPSVLVLQGIAMIVPFTSCGASRADRAVRRCWSRHTVRI
jgi:hypothetical protein